MNHPLPLAGEMPRPTTAPSLPLAAKGFRPFFLLAAAFAISILPLWMLALFGVFQPSAYLDAMSWHAHEMVFGFSIAVIAGFLLTAVGNWTQRETLVGTPLLALAALWVLGRIAVTCADSFPRWAPAIADLAFLPVLIVVLARSLVAAKNKRNFVMLAMLFALFVANLTIHLDALGVLPGWRRRGSLVAIDIVVLLIVVISGRTLPMFTRNATGSSTIRSIAVLDVLAIVATASLVILDAAVPDSVSASIASGIAGVLVAVRMLHWGARRSLGTPLLWILHAGCLWVSVGLVLRAIAAVTGIVPASTATHALTVGAIGALTLGMMARVSLGHSGRAIVASRLVVTSFVLVTLAALVRVSGTLVDPTHYLATVVTAGVLWTCAFALFLFAYARILVSPRVDGKPG